MSGIPLQDGRFLLLETLGHGGMGQVFRAFDRAEQRLVALKVLRCDAPHGPGHPLLAEFTTWAALRHPNIVVAHELSRARSGPLGAGRPYLVLEHVRGGPIDRVLRPGQIAGTHLQAIASQMLGALDHLHASGWVHRDLKPSNVLACPTPRAVPRVKVTDFGLAARIGRVARPGLVSGSVAYISPEALEGRPVDPRSDLYALGILLYQLACGVRPMTAEDPASIVRWHMAGPPADLTRLADLPPRLAVLIGTLLQRDPDRRPGSAAQALGLIEAEPRTSTTGTAWPLHPPILGPVLEAVRAGASRVVELDPDPDRAGGALADLALRAQFHGLCLYRVRGRGVEARANLARLVLRLLAERGGGDPAWVVRDLDRALPIALVGGLPILDPTTARPPTDPTRPARTIARFLLQCAKSRPTLLSFEAPAIDEPLVRAVVAFLRQTITRRDPEGKPGGLLVLATRRPLARAG